MRRTLVSVLAVLAVSAIAGCSTVSSDKLLGDKPVALAPADWDGKWLCKGEWCTIRVLDAQNGLFELIPPVPPKSAPEAPFRVSIRQSGNWLFANIHELPRSNEGKEKAPEEKADEEAQKEKRYLWGRIKNGDNQIIFWLPDAYKFEDLVEAGKLPGKATRKDDRLTVILNGLTADHMNLIMSETEGMLFEWDRPIVLVREKPAEEANGPPPEEKPEQ